MRFKAKLAPEQLTVFYNVVTPMARIASTTSSSSSGGGGGGGGFGTQRGGEPLSTSVWTRNSCILHLDANYARLYCRGKSMETDQVQCYAEFTARDSDTTTQKPAIFADYRIESAAEGNAICMEVDLAQLRLALQSLAHDKKQHNSNQSAFGMDPHYSTTVLKLAKRNSVPCLCLDAFTSGDGGGMPIQVHHSISVRILRLADMAHFRPPQFDRLRTADVVQLDLPPDRPLRTVMEGLKGLSGGGGGGGGGGGSHPSSSRSSASSSASGGASVTLRATTLGELTLSLDSDGASIRAYFHHLPTIASDDGADDADDDDDAEHRRGHPLNSSATGPPSQGGRPPQRKKKKTTARVRVDAKKLCSCLQWQPHGSSNSSSSSNSSFPVHRAVLCLVENEVLLVHVDLHPAGVGHQTYYVPVRYMDPDDGDDDDANDGAGAGTA